MQVPSNFVESVLGVHSHFSELIRKVFNNDQQFVGALDKVCTPHTLSSTPKPTPTPPLLLCLLKSSVVCSCTHIVDS